MIGAESGQCLPNAQLFYSFIRGAGKQYGVPWHAGISIFNRWGYKVYQEDMRTLPPEKYGPGATKGTSLALLKRLVYQQLFGNCSVIGLEGSHYITTKKDGDVLSPIGRLQRRAMDWYDRNGDPGILQTPVALMCDFYQGWTFPRHQYKHEVFRVWGMQPYDEGDHFADGVLEMLYPGYADSGYFRDERGFLSPTPYGDIADCILSDTAAWQLDRYGVVVLVGKITPPVFPQALLHSDGEAVQGDVENVRPAFEIRCKPAEDVVLLGKQHLVPLARKAVGGGQPAEPAADDNDVIAVFHAFPFPPKLIFPAAA